MLKRMVVGLALATASAALGQGGPPPTPVPDVFKIPLPPELPVDGSVKDLNRPVYAVLAAMREGNQKPPTARDLAELRAAILADNQRDAAEDDLLRELASPKLRVVLVSPAGARPREFAMITQGFGEARKVIADLVDRPPDLARLYVTGQPGWDAMIAEATKSPADEQRVVDFVALRLVEQSRLSTPANAYKPARELISHLYAWSKNARGGTAHAAVALALLHRAGGKADRDEADKIPDFLYNWIKPPA